MRGLPRAAIAAAALALGAAGCGDDGDSGPAGGELTKAQFITEADKVCKEVEAATKTYSDQVDALPEGSDSERIANILEGGLAETRRGVGRLKALRPPSEGKRTIDAYFASIDKAIATYADLLQAVSAGDEAKASRLADQADPLFDEQRRLARQYGFKRCRSL